MRRKYFGLAMAAVATLGPAQAFGDDKDIAKSIIDRLKVSRDAGDLKNFTLDMKVDDGVVLFRGKVTGDAQRAVVLATSEGVEGIRDVVDQLEVQEAVALAASKPAKIYRPKTSVQTTEATQESTTPEDSVEFAKALATSTEAIASSELPLPTETPAKLIPANLASAPVAQVNPHVDSNVAAKAQEVVPGLVLPTAAYEGTTANQAPAKASINDDQLTQSVVQAIGRAKAEGHVANFGIDVNSYDGIIELEGKAASQQQRDFLANIARHAPGARGVRNMIEVERPAATTRTVAHRSPQVAAQPRQAAPRLQPLPQGNPNAIAAMPSGHMSQPQGQYQQRQYQQQGVPARMASYGQGGQQMINGEMVVPGSMVNHGASAGSYGGQVSGAPMMGQPVPMAPAAPAGAPRYDSPNLPNYAWPGYAASPNYAALSYPQQYSPSAFPYIGPFYPYPQVPLGWRKVSLEWDDGWWMLDFTDK
ncbi:BON domain-containing protein [Neorhodopirellula lusitana]|uniref:BON domain-containing protein n=1 Tax=Neorhodopirellula lusitana TaxID=445327 RepID=A0ABY1QBZ3_9BACT|nr:BON domain-containing protein [Neorhodopirellula lusitana]SMP66062.1 BON domain-containing protein [Neorhodopirellula lusitana]